MHRTGCQSAKLQSDKVTLAGYQMMYGIYLMPLQQAAEPPRLLEIGLGCTMTYGPGRSARLWRKLLPDAQLWEADVDAPCVLAHQSRLRAQGINVLRGDAGNASVVRSWVEQISGPLDAVIDDGSHRAADVLTAFATLWPAVRPGGLYFVEDIGAPAMGNISRLLASWAQTKMRLSFAVDREAVERESRLVPWLRMPDDAAFRMPDDVAFINVFDNAAVIGKDLMEHRHVSTRRGSTC